MHPVGPVVHVKLVAHLRGRAHLNGDTGKHSIPGVRVGRHGKVYGPIPGCLRSAAWNTVLVQMWLVPVIPVQVKRTTPGVGGVAAEAMITGLLPGSTTVYGAGFTRSTLTAAHAPPTRLKNPAMASADIQSM